MPMSIFETALRRAAVDANPVSRECGHGAGAAAQKTILLAVYSSTAPDYRFFVIVNIDSFCLSDRLAGLNVRLPAPQSSSSSQVKVRRHE
jgi:hypothetical protein